MKRVFSKKSIKDIAKINSPHKQRIKNAIKDLPDGDVKKMKGYEGLYRLRVGSWRIIFSYATEDTILIEDVEPRGSIY